MHALTLGVAARYGLHPNRDSVHRIDQRLMPAICAVHRFVGRCTSSLNLPGRPMICLSLGGIRYPAVCLPGSRRRLAAVMFRHQAAALAARRQPIEEHGVLRRRPLFAGQMVAGRDINAQSRVTSPIGTWCLVVDRWT